MKYGQDSINTINPSKIKYFSAQAKALNVGEIKKFSDAKRHTILICFIYDNNFRTCDNLITMFIKRISKIHNKAKENLALLMENQRSKTENMLEVLQEILISSYECADNNKIANNFKNIVANNGGYELLIKDCAEITAYNNKNYYPLLWKSFKSHRKTFFEILKILSIGSTTDDMNLIKAIDYLLTCESKKSEFIDANIDLSFANKKWQKLIICKVNKKEVFSN